MVVLNVMYTMKEGKRAEDFLDKLENLGLAPYCRKERGNICYRYFLPADEENQLFLLEKWENKEALTAHGRTDNFARIGEIKSDFVESVEVQKFTVCD